MYEQYTNKLIYIENNPWSVLVICFFLVTLGGLLGEVLFRYMMPSSSAFFFQMFPPVFSYLFPAVYLIFRFGNLKLSDIKLTAPDLLIIFLVLIVIFTLGGMITLLGPIKPYSIQGNTLFELPDNQIYLISFATLLAGPFLEELTFRKYLLEKFQRYYSIVLAISIISAFEAFIHIGFILEWPIDLYLFLRHFCMFIFFSVVYVNSRLGVSFITHFLFNLTIMLLTWR